MNILFEDVMDENDDFGSGAVDLPSGGEETDPETGAWKKLRQNYEKSSSYKSLRQNAVRLLRIKYNWFTNSENDRLWCYAGTKGIYDDKGEPKLREVLVEKLGPHYSKEEKSQILDRLKGRTTISKDDIGGPENKICVKNGILDIKEMELETHSSDYNFISRMDVEYDPEADCPTFKEFLNDSLVSEKDKKKLQEYSGYTLMNWSMKYHKGLFIVGPTGSGKSTFLDTISELFDDTSISNLTPQQIVNERFSASALYGTWVNIRNDIPPHKIKNVGLIKEILAGDPIKIERKREDAFFYRPKTKHMFSSNQLPRSEIEDDAFFRRILLVSFPFSVPEEEQDKDLPDKLLKEKSGILNWMLKGLQRLRENKGFTGDESIQKTRGTWEEWGDPVAKFKSEKMVEDTGAVVAKSKVHSEFLDFCRENDFPSMSQHKLTRELKSKGIEDGRSRINGKQTRCFKDIRLDEGLEDFDESSKKNNQNKDKEVKEDTAQKNLQTNKDDNSEEVEDHPDQADHDIESQKDRMNFLTNKIGDGIEEEELLEIVQDHKVYDDPIKTKLLKDLENLKENGDIINPKPGFYRVV